MSDDRLRAAFQQHVRDRGRATGDGCPAPEQLQALARGPADGTPDIARLEHVLGCASCHAEFALLRAVASSEAAAVPTPARRSMNIVAIAAALLAVAGIGGEAWRRTRLPASAPVLRDAPAAASVVLVSPVSVTAAQLRQALRWHAVAGAEVYDIEVLDTAGELLFTRTTRDTALVLTDADVARAAAAGSFDWMVTARRGDGNERRSPLSRVQVRPEPAP